MSRKIIVAALLGWIGITAVDAKDIQLAISRPYTGPLKTVGEGYVEAVKAYFLRLNQQGGINGNKILLIEKDDEGLPAKTAANVGSINKDVVALIGVAGTANVLAALPALEKEGLPLVGAYAGSDALRDPMRKVLFHTRASYSDELSKLADVILPNVGAGKVLVFVQDDAFGASTFKTFQSLVTARKSKATLVSVKFDRASGEITDPAFKTDTIKEVGGVLLLAGTKSAAKQLALVRKVSPFVPAYTLSVVDALGLVKEAGASRAAGTVITQVVPNPKHGAIKAVSAYGRLAKEYNLTVSYAGFEGYLAARVTAEALKNIKGDATREKFIAAMESLGKVDIDGMAYEFGPNKHNGVTFVDTISLSRAGTLLD